MKNSYCIIVLGFSPSEMRTVLDHISPELKAKLSIAPVTQDALTWTTQEVISHTLDKKITPGPVLALDFQFVMMDVPREDAGDLLQAFKAVTKANQTIFSLPTETAKAWTLAYYLEHLREEHETMRNPLNKPQDDPDMEKM